MGTWQDGGGSWGDSPGSWTDMGQNWGDSGGGWADGRGGRWSDSGTPGTGTSSGGGGAPSSGDTQKIQEEIAAREAKRQALQSPTSQWASKEDYERAYFSYLREGGTPISHPAGIIPGSTLEERRVEAASYDASTAAPQVHQQGSMLKNPFTGQMLHDVRPDPYAGVRGIPGEEWLEKTREGKVLHVIPGEGYGWRYPEHVQEPGPMSRMFTPDSFTRGVDAQLAATEKMISGLDVSVSKALNLKGYLGSVYSGYRESERLQRQLVTEQSVGKPSLKMPEVFIESKRGTEQFVYGFGKGLAEKPVTTLGNVAIAFAVTKGMGAIVSKAPVLAHGVGVGRITRHISAANVIGAGMVGLYGADVGIRTVQSPRPVQTLGEITSTEIIPFGTGAYLGTKIKISDLLPKAKPAKTPRFITDKEPFVDLRKAYTKHVIETETWKDYENLMKANRWDLIDKTYPTPEPKPVIKILPKTKPDKSLVLIPDKSLVYITGKEPVVDVQKAFAKHVIETETWKDYENLMKANRWDLIDKTYPTPEPKPVKQIRTIDLSKDLIKLKPDFSVPAPRKTYPYGEYSKLTDRLVTPGEELIPIPKARFPVTTKQIDKLVTPGEELVPFPKAKLPETTKQGKVTILKDLNKELRTKWKAEDIKLGKMAQTQGYFTSPEGQMVRTQQVQILKQVQKTINVPKTIQRIRTVNLEKDLVGLTALAIPVLTRRKTKQIAVMPRSQSKTIEITIQKERQISRTIFNPIQVQRFDQVYGSKTAQIPIMKPIQLMKTAEKTISRQVSKTMIGYPEMRIPIIPKFKFPKFDNMGGPRKLKGRKASAYEIINPFSTLKDLIGDMGLPTSRKGKKQWWETL